MIKVAIEKISTPSDEKLLEEILKGLEKHSVYVGIPEDNAGRKAGEMNNPTLLYSLSWFSC